MAVNSRQGVDTDGVVKIKRGNAPEIQEVNISMRSRRSAASKYSTDNDDMIESGRISETELFHRRRPPSKTMTTKSTMTNEDDYQMEITKSLCAENIEHSSQPSSVHEGEVVELEDQKEEEQKKKNAQENHQQKFLSWKMTPRVHFPARQMSSSPVPSGVRNAYPGSIISTTNQTVDWQYLPEPVIEPPFEHRPDKAYLIHQNQPIPLNPLKVWPGYGGNLYFEPVSVQPKLLSTRATSDRITVSRSRSRATSRYTFGDHTESITDGLSDFKYYSLPPSSPSHKDSRKNMSPALHTEYHVLPKQPLRELQVGSHPGDLLFQRKMAHLDKNIVFRMKGNAKIHEDWSWIAGMESLGTLRLGDQSCSCPQRLSKKYTRTLVIEKVPRNFVFHPKTDNGSKTRLQGIEGQRGNQLWEKVPVREYSFWREQSISNWNVSGGNKNSYEQLDTKYKDLKGRRNLPSLPLRIKGKAVLDGDPYSPYQLRLGKAMQLHSARGIHTIRNRDRNRRLTENGNAFTQQNFQEKNSAYFSSEDQENKMLHPSKKIRNKYLRQVQPEPETDDEDKINYEALNSAYLVRHNSTPADGYTVSSKTSALKN